MTKHLLWRGMLAGSIGALVAATLALLFAEPSIDAAIAFEAHHAAHAMAGMDDEELVSRATQKGLGLYTAMIVYGAALGGLFAIAFAGAYGRLGQFGPRSLSLLLALAAFVVIVAVPAIKYPPTPPAVGLHETVRLRTGAYFAMLACSLIAAIGGVTAFRRLAGRHAPMDRLAVGLLAFVAIVALLQALLPVIDEVPGDFPATLLWQFRVAAIGTQGAYWLVTGYAFGRFAERLLLARTGTFR